MGVFAALADTASCSAALRHASSLTAARTLLTVVPRPAHVRPTTGCPLLNVLLDDAKAGHTEASGGHWEQTGVGMGRWLRPRSVERVMEEVPTAMLMMERLVRVRACTLCLRGPLADALSSDSATGRVDGR